ncbi:LOW QUALITY PROTEIN: hypothetical protein MXB_4927, partial [Myxobolus squamalis]
MENPAAIHLLVKENVAKIAKKSEGICDFEERCSGAHHEVFNIYNISVHRTKSDRISNYALQMDFAMTGAAQIIIVSVNLYTKMECFNIVSNLVQKNCSNESSETKKNQHVRPLLRFISFDPCQHFICAHPSYALRNTQGMRSTNGDICLYKIFNNLKKDTKQSPDYVKCSESQNHFCLSGKCEKDESKLKICRFHGCNQINNSYDRPIVKTCLSLIKFSFYRPVKDFLEYLYDTDVDDFIK